MVLTFVSIDITNVVDQIVYNMLFGSVVWIRSKISSSCVQFTCHMRLQNIIL